MPTRNQIIRYIQSASPGAALLDVLAALLSVFILFKLIQSRTSARFPPGPLGLPFVGVALRIPSDKQWLKFHEWITRYGDVVGLTVMGQRTLILGSFKAANDLLNTKGAIYSDRPNAVMAGELVGWDRGLGYAHGPDNARFRAFRRLFEQTIGHRACARADVRGMQERETWRLALRLLRDPQGFGRHARESAGALILRLAYGYEVPVKMGEHDREKGTDPLVSVVEVAMQGFSKASEPGAFWVDQFPVLRYVPEWMLWGGSENFKAVARRLRRDREEMYDLPFEFVQKAMDAGKALPSFTSTNLEQKGSTKPADEELIKAAAASLYSGGADTTPSSITAFMLAMTLYPSIQHRAQTELSTTLGPRLLPTLADRAALPYVNALVLEVLRWQPVVPLGLAHRVTEGDVYRGWDISEGTVVWANIWSMLHDPDVFPDPERFDPERFLNADGTLRELGRHEDPSLIAFGFGRRICPGMFFAMNSLFSAIATLLCVFDISKSKDEDGEEVVPEVDFRGFISHPVPFMCEIRPRSEAVAAEIIRLAGEVS